MKTQHTVQIPEGAVEMHYNPQEDGQWYTKIHGSVLSHTIVASIDMSTQPMLDRKNGALPTVGDIVSFKVPPRRDLRIGVVVMVLPAYASMNALTVCHTTGLDPDLYDGGQNWSHALSSQSYVVMSISDRPGLLCRPFWAQRLYHEDGSPRTCSLSQEHLKQTHPLLASMKWQGYNETQPAPQVKPIIINNPIELTQPTPQVEPIIINNPIALTEAIALQQVQCDDALGGLNYLVMGGIMIGSNNPAFISKDVHDLIASSQPCKLMLVPQ